MKLTKIFLSLALPLLTLGCGDGKGSGNRTDEVTFKGAEWDSLAIPLKIQPFYVNIDSPTVANGVLVEMDIYSKGTLDQTLHLSNFSRGQDEKFPLDMNMAIHFMPSEEDVLEGSFVLQWGGARGTNTFSTTVSEMDSRSGWGWGTFPTRIKPGERTPIFGIVIVQDGNMSFSHEPHKIPDLNPNSTVLIGYIKTE